MRLLERIAPKLVAPALALVCWLRLHGVAWAQPKPDDAEKTTASWVMPYMLVLLGICLGMLFVCRSSRRRERAKAEVAMVEQPKQKI